MADDEKSENGLEKLRQDRLVERLAPDPSDNPPKVQLMGWLGKGIKEGLWRLYLTSTLDEYRLADAVVRG